MTRRPVEAGPSRRGTKEAAASAPAAAGSDPKVTPLRPRRKCPECGRPSERASYPFCSPRCKAVDLNRWLSGSYVIPASEEEPSSPATDEPDR